MFLFYFLRGTLDTSIENNYLEVRGFSIVVEIIQRMSYLL